MPEEQERNSRVSEVKHVGFAASVKDPAPEKKEDVSLKPKAKSQARQKVYGRSQSHDLDSPSAASQKRKMIRRGSTLKRFSAVESTEDQFASDTPLFMGPYQHIRKELDYTYHKHYQKQRQWLQDSIIEDLLDQVNVEDVENVCVTPHEPWMIFTAGPRGAGKRHTIDDLVLDERLPLLGFISVDSDQIRRRLPEFDMYTQFHPELVDELTRKESGFIAEILVQAAVQLGRNVIFDGALKSTDWYLGLIDKLQKDPTTSQYKFGIFHITAPMDQIVARISRKSVDTGRVIPQISTLHDIESIKHGYEVLKPHVNYTCEIRNGKEELELLRVDDSESKEKPDISDPTDEETWELYFTQQFVQMCAWKPGMNGKTKMGRMSRVVSLVESQTTRKSMIQRASRIHNKPRFSVMISSEENNRMDEMLFWGRYSHIRKTL